MTGGSQSQVGVIIVDDDQLVRRTLMDFVRIEPAIKVLATFPKAQAAVEFARRNRVDVALVDIHMPGMNGVQATRELRTASPDTKVLILTSLDDDATIHSALDAGAAGYLLKSTSPEALVDAIRTISRGLSVMSLGNDDPGALEYASSCRGRAQTQRA